MSCKFLGNDLSYKMHCELTSNLKSEYDSWLIMGEIGVSPLGMFSVNFVLFDTLIVFDRVMSYSQ